MKRLIAMAGRLVPIASLALAACGGEPDAPVRPQREVQNGWFAPARFETAVFETGGVMLAGSSSPGDRIVLTDSGGVSVAATAGSDGAFSLRLSEPTAVTLFHAEIHSRGGQARVGEWLAVTPAPDAVASVLSAGAAAAPLNVSGLLAAVDYDGAAAIVSGVAPPGGVVRARVDDRPDQLVTVGPSGRYAVRFASVSPGQHRFRIESGDLIGEATLGLTPWSDGLRAMDAGVATRIDWPTPGGGFQSTWILKTAAGDD